MPDLADGEVAEVKGSSSTYKLRNVGGVYSCSCPAWANQSLGIERRTCKHLRAFRGDGAEQERLAAFGVTSLTGRPATLPTSRTPSAASAKGDDEGPPLLLAHKWELDVELTGWWMSEKLDGVRAYWDGTQFLSRLGNRFHPPPWFTDGLPEVPLDGELWGGRKLFQRTVGIVKRQDQSPLWKELFYVVFDAPAHAGTFEERMGFLQELVGDGKHPYVRVHLQEPCRGERHLREELARVEALGGEGLMVRRPGSRYEAGRSSTLLKVKSFHDAEARVLEHVPGAGRHKGRLGALLVELPDRTRFNVGTGFSDAERGAPPPVGSIITFRYQELSDGGVPRFPSYVGVRLDFRWPTDAGEAHAAPRHVAPGAAPPPSPAQPAQSPAPSPVALPVPVAIGTISGKRRFEMTDGETRYFWEIEREGAKHRVRFGTFDAKTKRFESEEDAAAALLSRIAEKLENGFIEVLE